MIALKISGLKVFFDPKRGGMPVGDSFGFLEASGIEVSRNLEPPHFQSLHDKHPQIESTKKKDRVTASGVLKRTNGKNSGHHYHMVAYLHKNSLVLNCHLQVEQPEKVVCSKAWIIMKGLTSCTMGSCHYTLRNYTGSEWIMLDHPCRRGPQTVPLMFNGKAGSLEVAGVVAPPIYTAIYINPGHKLVEVAYGWAGNPLRASKASGKVSLKPGSYVASLVLKYSGRR